MGRSNSRLRRLFPRPSSFTLGLLEMGEFQCSVCAFPPPCSVCSAQCFARPAAFGKSLFRPCRLPPNQSSARRVSRGRSALRCAPHATKALTLGSTRTACGGRVNLYVRHLAKGVFLCVAYRTKTKISASASARRMLCTVRALRPVLGKSLPLAAKRSASFHTALVCNRLGFH